MKNEVDWLVYFGSYSYIFVYGFGYGGAFWYYVTTVLPVEYVCFGGSIRFVFDLLSVYYGLNLLDGLGVTFWVIVSGVCVIIGVTTLVFGIDTKDKT